MVKVKGQCHMSCHQYIITFSVHRITYSYKVTYNADQLFFSFCADVSDTQIPLISYLISYLKIFGLKMTFCCSLFRRTVELPCGHAYRAEQSHQYGGHYPTKYPLHRAQLACRQ